MICVLLGLLLLLLADLLFVIRGFLLSAAQVDQIQRDLFPLAAFRAQVFNAVLGHLVFLDQLEGAVFKI